MITNIHLKNIRSFKDEEFSLSEGKNLIVGANGAGKTTIIDCIGYVLFGYDDAIRKSERIVDEYNNEISGTEKYGLVKYDAQGDAFIDICFVNDLRDPKSEGKKRQELRVKVSFFSKKRGNPEEFWELWVDDKKINISNKKPDVRRELWKLMGIDQFISETFFPSILCIPQGEIVQPFELSGLRRIEYFDKIFGIAQRGELEFKYKIIEKYLEKEIEKLAIKASELEGKVSNKTEIENRRNENEKELPNTEREFNDISNQLTSLEKQLEAFNQLKREIDKTNHKIDSIEDNINRLKRQITDAEKQINDYKKQLKEYPDYENIEIEYIKISEINNSIKDIELKILNLEKEQTKSEAELLSHQKTIEQSQNDLKILKEAEPNYKKYIELESTLKNLKQQQEQRQQIIKSIESIEQRINELKNKIQNLQDQTKDFDTIGKKVLELREENEELIKLKQDKSNSEKELKKDEKTLKDFGNKVCPFTSEQCMASTEVSTSIKEKIEEKKKELEVITQKIKDLDSKIKELPKLEKILQDLITKKGLLEDFKKQKEKEQNTIEADKKDLEKIPDVTKEIVSVEQDLESLKPAYSTVISYQKQGKTVEKLEAEMKKIQIKIDETNKSLKKIHENFQKLNDDYSKKSYTLILENSLKSMSNNGIFKEKANYKGDIEKIATISTQIKKSEDINILKTFASEYFDALKPLEAVYISLKQIKEIKLPEKENQKSSLQSQLSEQTNSLLELNSELTQLKRQYNEDEHQTVQNYYVATNQKKGEITQKLSQIKNRIEEDNKYLAQIAIWEKEIEELNKKRDITEKEKELNEKLKGAMSSLTKLRERYINHVNREVQIINAAIGHPGTEIYWDPSYIIYIRKATTLLTFNQLSGGQKVLYALMIRLAINKLFSRRFGLFILDEPTIHLDEESRRILSNFIDQMEGIKQLIIVSHTEEFLGTIDNEIELKQTEYKTINVKNEIVAKND